MPLEKKIYILDRFENGLAVMIGQDGEEIVVPSPGGREGDVFECAADGGFVPCPDETERRRAQIKKRMDKLFRK